KIFSVHKEKSIIWLAALIILWEVSARLGLTNTYILPPFSTVMPRLYRELVFGRLGLQTLSSIWLVSLGFLISFALAVVITALCAWLKPIEGLFNTLSNILNPLPAVAIMPLIIMWFGIELKAMCIIIIHGVLWTLVRHLLDGLRSVSAAQIEFGRNIGLSPRKMFTGITIYMLMPEFLAGLRTGWGRAWRAVISVEMVFGIIGAAGGLGYYIYMGRAYAKIADVLAGVIVIAAIGILAEFLVFSQIERVTTRKWGMTRE
ncbi:MAG: ABC transporter permease subunit, partial [Clostridiales bacterium]|nr:ABC transporter permease subunit [Clostridiales bacterium]